MIIHKILHEIIRPISDLNKKILKYKEAAFQKLTKEGEAIIVDADVYRGWTGKIIPQNWGDDLNAHFLIPLLKKKLFFLRNNSQEIHYQFIGSIIGSHKKNDSRKRIIWGSGLLRKISTCPEDFKNQTFLAVRGPLTRKTLIQNGIDCPEVYGDPALLLPRLVDYTPPLPSERSGIGVVSAWWEHKNPVFFNFMKKVESDGARHIKTRGYKDWKDFIKEICNSEFVISSSLHGVIVAEAYNIPCLWVIFSKKQQNEDHYFKYWDFYQSIGKNIPHPILITESTTLEELREHVKRWSPGQIDTDALIASSPFPISTTNKVK